MTRIIKASEVKPGMTIRAEYLGVTKELTVSYIDPVRDTGGAEARTGLGGFVYLSGRKPVTVLSEPAPTQPEEPTEFGARVVVDGRRFLRSPEDRVDSQPWLEENEGTWRDWEELTYLGPVTVIPDQGWAVPGTPEVPDRIEEWPESDEHLRPYPWRDRDGDTWTWAKAQATWVCRDHRGDSQMARSRPSSWHAPFTRVTDA